ncbi:MAG: Type restriction-modification system, restriction subunit [Bacteroidetes bacterium]|nr:Type restriction-modification system, restriction subunit [Bacteroidota bacterium]
MNEAETRAELIDPKLRENGWDSRANPGVKIHREYIIAPGKIKTDGRREKAVIADYVLAYKGVKLAVVEAKSEELHVSEGVGQAKGYALKLKLDHSYAANGKEIYYMDLDSATEHEVDDFHTPDELWQKTFPESNQWQDDFNELPYEDNSGSKPARFYQDIAIEKTMEAIANKKNRILLTLATGTGKTFIAFQIAWKLFYTRWNLAYDGSRRPRILFLADRNILANQAFNAFTAFPDDCLIRIKPSEIKKTGNVPTNGSIFFTIFQTFMSGKDKKGDPVPYFGQYPPDYFDLIIIDECHRGGANDESNWRGILEYFSPAVQLGLTATPKRKENTDTYKYFGEPVYIYSLKDGINDGFLTPFKVKQITTSLDTYTYDSDDKLVEGEIEEGRTYKESDFNRIIEIKEREKKRVKVFMDLIDQKEKTLVFCANQEHAAAVRDLINQYARSRDPHYCVRVTANDGEMGEQYLRDFQNNDKTIPTILTTSQKLSTGVDARNIRNIILMRPVNNIIEFKQIVGRGTRLFDGKYFFTLYDFVNASARFKDPEWDGEPVEPDATVYTPTEDVEPIIVREPDPDMEKKKKIKVKLRNGKEHEITHTVTTSFFNAAGQPITAQEFLNLLYGKLPELFTSEEDLRRIWSIPSTRATLLKNLDEAGFGPDELSSLQKLIDAERSDLFDVLEYVAFSEKPLTRETRVGNAQQNIFALLDKDQKEFLEFVLSKYIETGVEELEQEKLPHLLELKYQAVSDAAEKLGGVTKVRDLFIGFQKFLYERKAS